MSKFSVSLSYRGQSITLENRVSTNTTTKELYELTRQAYGFSSSSPDNKVELKLLFKGKKLNIIDPETPVFTKIPTKVPKILVMATSNTTVQQIVQQKSDPLLRGFDQEEKKMTQNNKTTSTIWNSHGQDRHYKFVKLEACTWQSFGHRPSVETTPHAFEAHRLLEQLATDPGIVAIMKERELVVNTLGEMDPIDDRIMQAKQQKNNNNTSSSCLLLGYNTNHGLRIDIKLRTEDLSGFRPYPELVSTLIHELSHNWVGDHNLLFWTNYGQMRAEYLYCHLHNTNLVNGKTTATLAGLSSVLKSTKDILPFLLHEELAKDMQQHGLHPNMIQAPIQQRCQELEDAYYQTKITAQRLGGASSSSTLSTSNNAREQMLAAAERRRQQQQQEEENEEKKS